MKRFILPTLLCLIAGSLHAKAPYIILMCADNIGYGDLGCYGNIGIKTPRIDQLAAEGGALHRLLRRQFHLHCLPWGAAHGLSFTHKIET